MNFHRGRRGNAHRIFVDQFGRFNPRSSLEKNGIDAARLAIGCAFLLVIAGIIEGFLSPSNLPAFVKYGTGILTGIAMYSYLLLVGRENKMEGV